MLKVHIKDDFKNLLEYQAWVKTTMEHISELNTHNLSKFDKETVERRMKIEPRWYGEGSTFLEMEAGITEFKDPELIEKIYNQVNDRISAGVKDRIKARKVMYNPLGLGIFSFDRASMGMYRLKELYSDSLKRKVEDMEVSKTAKGFQLKEDSSVVVQRWEEKEDATPKIRTSSKNVYAYFPPIKRQNKAVELFIACGANSNIDATRFLYSGISSIIIAQLLEKARIKTRISIAIGSSPDGYKNNAFAAIIPVKNYDENLDMNLLALLTSDPRFFRYEGFKGIVSLYDHFGQTAPATLGSGMDRDFLVKTIEKSDYTKKIKRASNRFYFGWTFSEAEAIRQVNETIEEIASRFEQ